MKHISIMRTIQNVTFVIGFSLFVILSMSPSPAQASWQTGAAKVVITPDEPMRMGGYASRVKPSEGKLHDLYAKALVLQDETGSQVVMVTTDLIGIPRLLRENLELRVAEQFNLKPSQLLLNASHTHCGPELRPEKSTIYELDTQLVEQCRNYLKNLEDKIVTLIGEARSNLKDSEVYYSHAQAGFAMNRRLPVKGKFINSPYPDGPVQHNVPVLIAKDAETKKLTAVLFGYACHNTTLGIQKFTGDYAGFAQQYFEEAHPETVALFMMGCGADQNPYPRSKIELAKQHGRSLALAVERALIYQSPEKVTGKISFALDHTPLDFARSLSKSEWEQQLNDSNKYIRRHAKLMLQQIEQLGAVPEQYPYKVQVLQIGSDLTMVALAGEVVVDYDHLFKKELPTKHVWVAGYSNDVFGYVPSLRVLKEGGYEGGGAMIYSSLPGPFAENIEQKISDKVKELHRSLP